MAKKKTKSREIDKSVQTTVNKVDGKSVQETVKVNLAGDIIESNILTRLPVHTLIRFRSVCKSWYSLFSDPYFIDLHTQIQKNKTSNLLLIDYPFVNNGNDIVVKGHYSRKQSKLWSFKHTIDFPYEWSKVVGCCDGIVCVSGFSVNNCERHISLWNPALRINKMIASYRTPHQSDVCVGFGYDNQTNDYNVIRFSNDLAKLNCVEIYSLNSDSWRKIELDSDQLLVNDYFVRHIGIYVNRRPGGAYCWLACKQDHGGNFPLDMIISFHMEDEEFKEMMIPYDTTTDHRGNSTLFIYKNLLALLHTYDSDASIPFCSKMCAIWVMKEFDDPKSWTKLCEFDSQRFYVSFVGVIENDLILLLCGNRGDLINPINKEVYAVDVDKSQMNRTRYTKDIAKARWVSSFTESLTLLKGVQSEKSHSN